MHNRLMCGALWLALVLATSPARAQEGGFGLDLSTDAPPQTPEQGEEPPPDTGSLGLDLSSGPSSELQPRFAFVGLDTPERAGAAVAKRWVGWLQAAAFRTGRVARAADPAEVKKQLGAEYAAALRCQEAACLSGAADTLDTDLLTTARLALEDGGWTLRLFTYDRDRGVVETDVVSGRKPGDGAFFREAGAVMAKRVTGLARPRSLLKVSCNVSQAVVRVGPRLLGVGTVEAKLPPGEVQLVVEADDYTPSTQTLTLVAGETKEVAVRLELNGPTPEGPQYSDAVASAQKSRGSSGPSVFSRPALYTTVLGLAAVGAGVALGMGLSETGQAVDGDGVREISRAQYLAAQRQGVLATALMAGGGAVAAGSIVWLIVVPNRSPVATSVAPVAGAPASQSMALHFVFGGSF